MQATEWLASLYPSVEARRGVWRGAAMVRHQMAQQSQSEQERQHHQRLATLYEARMATAGE